MARLQAQLARLTHVLSGILCVLVFCHPAPANGLPSAHPEDVGMSSQRLAMITPLQLLTHFSGLRPGLDLDELWTGYDSAIELAVEEQPVSVPGTRFRYSDINYILLSAVVREVSGVPLDEFSRQRIFLPLGMLNTSFNPPKAFVGRVAPTQFRDGRLLRGEVHDPTSERMGGVAGHAGLFSTVDDIAIFSQMILEQGAFAGTRVLSPLAIQRMTTNQSPSESDAWRGVGFDIRTRFSSNRGDLFPVGSFGHTGFTGTSIWIDPASSTFLVILTSRLHPDSGGNVVRLRKQLANIVAAAIEIPGRMGH
jgi:CubicO group peptidase (beta-lactamase class C family)